MTDEPTLPEPEPQRRYDDPGNPINEGVPESTDPDDVVGRVVEKAAQKVANSVTSSPSPKATMSRVEAWGAIIALIILNVASLIATITLRNDHEHLTNTTIENRHTTQAACELIGQAVPNVDPAKLARCLAK
jgi:hypothetical protein